MMDFQIGDIVRLKSGGPDMTVRIDAANNYETAGEVRCVWFEGKKLVFGDFVPATLMKVDDTPFAVATI